MRSIQSIICFNSGSAGDFLKAISNEQIKNHLLHQISKNGAIEVTNDFKKTAEQIFYKKLSTDAIFKVKSQPVENTHYYLEQFRNITPNLFYIDYPDHLNQNIVEIYVNKRLNGNQTNFFNSFKSSLPELLKEKLTIEDLNKASQINWAKNIKSWRENKNLQPVFLKNFFDVTVFKEIVKTVSNLPELNEDKFLKTYNQWIENNNYLKEVFTK